MAKLFSMHFYRTAHFKKLKESLEKEYYLQVLSVPRSRALANQADQVADGKEEKEGKQQEGGPQLEGEQQGQGQQQRSSRAGKRTSWRVFPFKLRSETGGGGRPGAGANGSAGDCGGGAAAKSSGTAAGARSSLGSGRGGDGTVAVQNSNGGGRATVGLAATAPANGKPGPGDVTLVVLGGVPLLQGFSTFSATVLAMTFIFGNSAKGAFESVLFLFFQHPYDVGDMIVLNGDAMRVKRISLMYTDFVK
ncbi:hypothetical protein GPECTOR_1708g820 [Gonium pectorale]|uniref:Uncharacterized protein n=1 Tax=Gonium pectorale TaxID=33097 RepID=A0A150FTG1_GONPE|nr:hypothetical protein GPECTOR_1708g820 [Gonium pectorale]|eukprot:KXZ40868.1 hypothetical protein GPECTOR_1708g820 [Gonium pectorale]